MVLNKWLEFAFKVDSKLDGDSAIIGNGVRKFLKSTSIRSQLGANRRLLFILKVRFDTNIYKSVTPLQEFKLEDLDRLALLCEAF